MFKKKVAATELAQMGLLAMFVILTTAFIALGQQSGGAITGAAGTENLIGEIRWKVAWGVPATDPSAKTPLSNICRPFSVSVVEGDNIISTDSNLTPGRADGKYYRCRYKLFAPRGRPVRIRPDISEEFSKSPWYNGQTLAAATSGGTVKVPFGSVRLPSQAEEVRVFDQIEKQVTIGPVKDTWLAFELATSAEFSGRSSIFYGYQLEIAINWSRTPLDWCREWGVNCGKPAADAFCITKGFERAKRFEKGGKLPKTMTITEKRICTGGCDSFAMIECVKD